MIIFFKMPSAGNISFKSSVKNLKFPPNILIPTFLVFFAFTFVELNTVWYSFSVAKRIVILIFIIFENLLMVVMIIRPKRGTDSLS